MAIFYEYVLAVWLELETAATEAELSAELLEHLEAEYSVVHLEIVADAEPTAEGETTVLLQLQLTFDESEMEDDEPTEEALDELSGELRGHLEAKYHVSYFEILDDALTSYLLAEHEEPAERKYPQPKQRDLTSDEKAQLRARIERGDADVYALAAEFGCSASQVAGVKAAMHR